MRPFYTILTNYGKTALAEALAAQKKLEIPYMAAGDGGGAYYEPIEEQTNLRNELWRGDLNDLRTEEAVQGQVIAEAIIPMGIDGDWTVREIGLFDKSNRLIAVGKYPETYIPPALSGAKMQTHISIVIKIDNTAAVQLIVDHGQVLASKLFLYEQGHCSVGSFESGIYLPYLSTSLQMVLFKNDGRFYHWTGEFPKYVSSNSSPMNDGGIHYGAWLPVNLSSKEIYAEDYGIDLSGKTDVSSKIQSLLDAGYKVNLRDDQLIGLSSPISLETPRSGIIGGAINILSNINEPILQVKCEDAVLTTSFNGQGYKGFGVVRVYPGSKRFQAPKLTFNDFYSKDKSAFVGLWIDLDGTDDFEVGTINAEKIRVVGDGLEGNLDGSLTLVYLRATQDNEIGGKINSVLFDDCWCVDESGHLITEDADAVKLGGWKRTPIDIGLIKGRNIGKRCLKTQGKGLHCKSISYTHTNTELSHRCVFDQQDGECSVGVISAQGNIESVYRTLAKDKNSPLIKGGVNRIDVTTTFVSSASPISAIGIVDIQSGDDISIPVCNITGGLVGLRIDCRYSSGVKNIHINANIDAVHALAIRNISTEDSIIDNITLTGNFKSNNPTLTGGSFAFTANKGKIGSVSLPNINFESNSSTQPSFRFSGINALRIGAISVDSQFTNSGELSNLEFVSLSSLRDANTVGTSIRMDDINSGIIAGVNVATASPALYVYNSKNIDFGSVVNSGGGTGIAFRGTCLNCTVNSSTKKVNAPMDFNDSNVIWDGAPAYGTEGMRVNIVKRGFVFRNTTSGKTALWTGFDWIGL